MSESPVFSNGQRGGGPILLTSRTHDHLRSAFASEGQSHQLLLYFAIVAEIEGHADVADLLRELAEAHALHAHGHLDLLRCSAEPLTGLPMGGTLRNLECALAAEQRAAREDYASMARTAAAEGFLDIADWLKTVALAGEAHAQRLSQAALRLSEPQGATGRFASSESLHNAP